MWGVYPLRAGAIVGQPQRRELADGLLFPAQAVLTRFDDEDRPLAVFAEVGRPRDPGHPAPFHDRITFDFSMSPIGLLPSPAIRLVPAPSGERDGDANHGASLLPPEWECMTADRHRHASDHPA
jgi:hypothetical protein